MLKSVSTFSPQFETTTIIYSMQQVNKMSPRRPKRQLQPSLVSDYESDANYLSDIPPPPAERTDEQLNLAVLQRHNRDVMSLEYVAPYAVVYVFSQPSQQWEKSGIEGTVFLCGLLPNHEFSQRYTVIVLNRRGLENFNLELASSDDVEITEEYIILQSENNGVPCVYGLWVFSEPPPSSTSHDRAAIAQKIFECAEIAELSRRLPQVEEEESVPMGRQVSLKELFGHQRQEDHSWSSHSPQVSQPQFTTSADTDFFRTPQRHGKTPSPAVSAQSNGQRDILVDLFRQAGNGFKA